jgi:hypothetical protein
VKGINARLRFEKSTQAPFTRADIYSFNAVAGQLFGRGGGDEARRSQFLSGLTGRLGDSAGNLLFDDLSELNDPDAPTTMTRSASYEALPSPNDRTGNAILDAGSFQAGSVDAGRFDAGRRVRAAQVGVELPDGLRQAVGHRAPAVRRRARRSATTTPASRSSSTCTGRATRRAARRRRRSRARS